MQVSIRGRNAQKRYLWIENHHATVVCLKIYLSKIFTADSQDAEVYAMSYITKLTVRIYQNANALYEINKNGLRLSHGFQNKQIYY